MKVALCQINTTIGDFTGNQEKIINSILKAASSNADLAVFPELVLSSYPPLDLLDRPDFIDANQFALELLLKQIKEKKITIPYIILGTITKNNSKSGRALFNSAVVIENKANKVEIIHTQSKRLLPTYDVFDETRYFEPAEKSHLWSSPFGKIGITICEDAWYDDRPGGRQLYEKNPADDLSDADIVINISASPFEMNKQEKRRKMLELFSQKTKAKLIYVNQVGANDEILFDGTSSIYNENGKRLHESPVFEESIEVLDLEKLNPLNQSVVTPMATLHSALVSGIKDYFSKTGFKKAVLGLSGGIDSAVIACLAVEALGKEYVLCVAMPGQFSSSHSLGDAEYLAKNLGVELRVHSIKFINSTLLMEIKPSFQGLPSDVTEENIQSRLRGLILLALSNKRNALLLTTGNKSELATGYCTTYGDMAGALAPIGDLYKTKVYDLARYINKIRPGMIPDNILTKAPSAELKPNQKDEDSLGSYEELDRLLEFYLEGQLSANDLVKEGFDRDFVDKTLKLIRMSEFKRRQAAPVLKVTSKAFGIGRRIPIAKKQFE